MSLVTGLLLHQIHQLVSVSVLKRHGELWVFTAFCGWKTAAGSGRRKKTQSHSSEAPAGPVNLTNKVSRQVSIQVIKIRNERNRNVSRGQR